MNSVMNAFFVVLLSGSSVQAFEKAVVSNTVAKKEVRLGADAEKALKDWNPKFELYSLNDFASTVVNLFDDNAQELPMAIIGDFDGDGESDIAVYGHDKTHQYALILVNQKTSYSVVEVDKHDYDPDDQIPGSRGLEPGIGTYISLLKSEDLEFKKKSPLKGKLNALQVETYGGSTTAHYIKRTGDKFEAKEYKGLVE